MNAFTLARPTTEPNAPSAPVRQAPREACPTGSGDQVQKQEADRLFEAGVQWFLAVSRAA